MCAPVVIFSCLSRSQSDLWSLGITALEMAEGAPRKSETHTHAHAHIADGSLSSLFCLYVRIFPLRIHFALPITVPVPICSSVFNSRPPLSLSLCRCHCDSLLLSL